MIDLFSPGLILILGAFVLPILRGRSRNFVLVALPLLVLFFVAGLGDGDGATIQFLGHELIPLRVDALSRLFGFLFGLAALIGGVYAMHLETNDEHVVSFIYMGSALGVVFAGDFFTLFFFWETMTLGSTYLIWARRTEAAGRAGLRYFLVHLLGGLFLLAGIALRVMETGSIAVGPIIADDLAGWLILLGFAMNAAIPPLHAWLPDAYPFSTATGTVFISSFTTKTAIYALARTFPGTEILIPFGTVMILFPIFLAVLENDTRRVLSYSLINQVGFMVIGIGIGTPLAVNGAVAHAFANVMFEGLLFMCTGAVMLMTGKTRCTDLGGLYKTMPVTLVFCLIGAASISAVPLFIGFATKSLIFAAVEDQGLTLLWFAMLFASAGVFHHAGIKIPYFIFFAHDSGIRAADPPMNMRIAMGISAGFCLLIGFFPGLLYELLPFPTAFEPYTGFHVLAQLQLLFFSALAFLVLMVYGFYPAEQVSINLDLDWFYRKGLSRLIGGFERMIRAMGAGIRGTTRRMADQTGSAIKWALSPAPISSRLGFEEWFASRPVGVTVLWVTVYLLACLVLYYV